jgi:hypothetical protein
MNGCAIYTSPSTTSLNQEFKHDCLFNQGENGGNQGSPQDGVYGKQLSYIPPMGWAWIHPITPKYVRDLESGTQRSGESQQKQNQFFFSMFS